MGEVLEPRGSCAIRRPSYAVLYIHSQVTFVEMGSMGLRRIKPFNAHSTIMQFYDYLHFTYENMETQTTRSLPWATWPLSNKLRMTTQESLAWQGRLTMPSHQASCLSMR